MKHWRLVAVVVVLIFGAFGINSVREKGKQQERDLAYGAVLRSYSEVVKPGMTRKEVEDYLRSKNLTFRQMCCVDYKTPKGVWDDLTKIAQEDPPFFCNEKNIYVAFQFAGGRPHNAVPSAEDADRLTAVTIYPWLERCL